MSSGSGDSDSGSGIAISMMPSSHRVLWPVPLQIHVIHIVIHAIVNCVMPFIMHPRVDDGEGGGPEGLPTAATPTMEAAAS